MRQLAPPTMLDSRRNLTAPLHRWSRSAPMRSLRQRRQSSIRTRRGGVSLHSKISSRRKMLCMLKQPTTPQTAPIQRARQLPRAKVRIYSFSPNSDAESHPGQAILTSYNLLHLLLFLAPWCAPHHPADSARPPAACQLQCVLWPIYPQPSSKY